MLCVILLMMLMLLLLLLVLLLLRQEVLLLLYENRRCLVVRPGISLRSLAMLRPLCTSTRRGRFLDESG